MKTLNALLSELSICNLQDVFDLQTDSVDEIIESDGEISALELSVKAKGLMKVLEGFIKQTAKQALEEAEKQISGKAKSFEMYGASISVGQVGVKWYYDKTGDPEIAELAEQAKNLKAITDKRAKFLQTLDKPLKQVDEETGEVVTIYPAYKTGTTSVKVSFGKDDE